MNPKIVTITLNPAIDHTASIPYFRAGEVNRVEWEQIDPGGKGVNVASFLTDFDQDVTVSGFLGRGNAALFESFFAEKNIQNRFVSIAGNTRVNVKIIDSEQNQITDINFPGQVPIKQDIASLYETIDDLTTDHDWFVLAGSLPAGLSPDIYSKLIARLKALNKTVVLDASGESLRQAIPFAPYAIKPNLAELQELVGRPLDNESAILHAIRDLVAGGIQYVVVSMGADGAIFADRDAIVKAHPLKVEVVSTVGAGDAMIAGLITSKLRGFSLPDCARLATAFSIGALSQIGPRLPPRSTVESFMTRVKVEPMS